MAIGSRPEPAQRPMLDIRDLVTATTPGGARAVDGVSLGVAPGQIFTLLGPSASGKTALLRAVAGLDTPIAGSISLDGKTLFSTPANCNLPPAQRDVAMLLQNNTAWPHATVAENVAAGLEGRGYAPAVQRAARIRVRLAKRQPQHGALAVEALDFDAERVGVW